MNTQEIQQQAETSDAEAQYALGLAYYKGEGVLKDEIQADQWFEKAAKQGHEWARYYHEKIHRPPFQPKSKEQIRREERSTKVGFFLLGCVLAVVIGIPLLMLGFVFLPFVLVPVMIESFRENRRLFQEAIKAVGEQSQYAAEVAIYQKQRWFYGWQLAKRRGRARSQGKPLPLDVRKAIKDYVHVEKDFAAIENSYPKKPADGELDTVPRCGCIIKRFWPQPPIKGRRNGLSVDKSQFRKRSLDSKEPPVAKYFTAFSFSR